MTKVRNIAISILPGTAHRLETPVFPGSHWPRDDPDMLVNSAGKDLTMMPSDPTAKLHAKSRIPLDPTAKSIAGLTTHAGSHEKNRGLNLES